MHSMLKKTVLGFFGHVTRQASGSHEGEAVENIENYALVNAL
jgi:hypothetical protein